MKKLLILTNLVEAVLICYIVDKDSTWEDVEIFPEKNFSNLQPHHVNPCSRSDQARETVLGLRCPK